MPVQQIEETLLLHHPATLAGLSCVDLLRISFFLDIIRMHAIAPPNQHTFLSFFLNCHPTRLGMKHLPQGARWLKWLEREFTDRKVRGSIPTSVSRLPLSRLGQPGSIPALVLPSGGMAARHRKVVLLRYTELHLVSTGDSNESLVYGILRLNVLHKGRLMFQLVRRSRYRNTSYRRNTLLIRLLTTLFATAR
ncbi:hypothetical protein CSKR_105028 [Clonorchis sinensis]|uniref:Uncharacterized protein n=1 Tax=Clonorchis sinensis TaxID=79923 RepID=A0A419PT85_CLOSI|nr:hypothetical protein CSKR_105028 [Clonorchis sinensis]